MFRSSTLAPLRIPDFRRLAGAYLVNEAGNWLGDVALAIVIYGASGSTLATALLLLVTRGLPSLLAPAAATRLAHLSLRRALPALFGAEAAIMGALALLLGHLPWGVIIAIAAVDGVVAVAARSVSRAAVATLLAPEGLLAEGNALVNIAFTAAGMLGPPVAGVLYAAAGGGVTLAVDAATFAAAAVVLIGLTPRALVEGGSAVDWRRRLHEGLSFVAGNVLARRTLGVQAAALVFMTAVAPIEVAFATSTLDAGAGGFGALVAAWGLGMPAGAVLFSRYGRRHLTPALLLATVAVGASYLLTAVAGTIAAACAFALIGGAANAVQWVAFVTVLQGLAAPRHQAAIAGLIETVGSFTPTIGFALGGTVAALAGPRVGYAVAGVGVLAVVVIAVAGSWRARGRPLGPAVEVSPVPLTPVPAPRGEPVVSAPGPV